MSSPDIGKQASSMIEMLLLKVSRKKTCNFAIQYTIYVCCESWSAERERTQVAASERDNVRKSDAPLRTSPFGRTHCLWPCALLPTAMIQPEISTSISLAARPHTLFPTLETALDACMQWFFMRHFAAKKAVGVLVRAPMETRCSTRQQILCHNCTPHHNRVAHSDSA